MSLNDPTEEILEINNAGIIHLETLAVKSKFSHLKTPFHISRNLQEAVFPTGSGVRITDFPEVITVSSTQMQHQCPHCWTVLSAVPSSWLY